MDHLSFYLSEIFLSYRIYWWIENSSLTNHVPATSSFKEVFLLAFIFCCFWWEFSHNSYCFSLVCNVFCCCCFLILPAASTVFSVSLFFIGVNKLWFNKSWKTWVFLLCNNFLWYEWLFSLSLHNFQKTSQILWSILKLEHLFYSLAFVN